MSSTKQLDPRVLEFLKQRQSGQVEPGNIDLAKRPIAYNKDGSYSTVRTIGFTDGKVHRNIPTVTADGRVVGPDEAIREYRRTGQHLGAYSTPEAAERAAQNLHEEQAGDYDTRAEANEPTTGPANPAYSKMRETSIMADKGQAALDEAQGNHNGHSENWNRPAPGGGAAPDPYMNAILDTVSGGVAGAVRPTVSRAVSEGLDVALTGRELPAPTWSTRVTNSVSPAQMARMSHRDILKALGNSRQEAYNIASATTDTTPAALEAREAARIADAMRRPGVQSNAWSGEARASDLSKQFYDAEEGRMGDLANVAENRAAHPEDATGVLKAPQQPVQGEVAITGVNKAPFPPGEAPRADGMSPQDVVKAQMEKLNKYRPPEKMAQGGVVPEASDPQPHHMYQAAAGCVAKYCSGGAAKFAAGGTVDEVPHEPSDTEDAYTPQFLASTEPQAEQGLIPQAELRQPAPVPEPGTVPQAELASVPVPQSTPVPHGAEQPSADPKVAVGDAQLRQDDDPSLRRLALIERMRAQALKNAEPTGGDRALRGIGSALTAFGGGKPTDFAAEDRANRGEINAGFDRQRTDFLSGPSEIAARNAHDASSKDSTQFRGLVAKTLGVAVNGLSSAQVTAALPFLQAAQAAKISGNQLEYQQSVERGRQAVEAHKEDVDAQKLEIDRQNAESNRLRALQAGAAHGDSKIENYFKAEEALKNAPDVRQADLDILAIKKINEILANPDPDTNAIAKLKAELAKIATGGEGSQHLQDELGRPTLRGKLSEAIQMVTGQPGSAGYKDIIKQSIKPYVNDIDRVVRQQRIQHELDVLKKHASTLDPAFVRQRHQQILDEAKSDDTATSSNPLDKYREFGAVHSD